MLASLVLQVSPWRARVCGPAGRRAGLTLCCWTRLDLRRRSCLPSPRRPEARGHARPSPPLVVPLNQQWWWAFRGARPRRSVWRAGFSLAGISRLCVRQTRVASETRVFVSVASRLYGCDSPPAALLLEPSAPVTFNVSAGEARERCAHCACLCEASCWRAGAVFGRLGLGACARIGVFGGRQGRRTEHP